MKFYEIDNALQEAINAADKPIRLKIEIAVAKHFESVYEQDIVEANFFGLKGTDGGTSARGEILLDNPKGIYSYTSVKPGAEIRVSFSMGDGLPFFRRFVFYLDEKGIQDIRGNGRKRFIRLNVQDLSAKLKKTDEARDWTSPAVFTYMVICDKTQPEKSLLHCMAKRAGLNNNDIDCSTIPVTLPYVKLRRNIWAELSSLATAYRCHLECAPEKPLVFAHSPYQTELLQDDEYSYTFTGENIFYLRKTERAELYRNTVRLKINLPVTLERQEIWQYDEPPVLYDDYLQAYYPFKYPLIREIEAGKYEAKYRIKDSDGKERNVVYADEIDTKEEAESRLEYDGGTLTYSHYDVTTNQDRATVQLHKTADGDLYKAAIHGRPIVLDLNRSCFLRDEDGIANYGTAALNITGSYFSEYKVPDNLSDTLQGKPHYEDWVSRELAERKQNRQEYCVKTNRALFHARVGAKVKIETKNDNYFGTIHSFSFRYKKDKAFVATFNILAERG